jgi:hypothetical protein
MARKPTGDGHDRTGVQADPMHQPWHSYGDEQVAQHQGRSMANNWELTIRGKGWFYRNWRPGEIELQP